MEKQTTMTDFFDKYTTEHNQVLIKELYTMGHEHSISPDDMCSFGGCMYETFGEELDYVKTKLNKNIWTIVDNEEGDLTIIAGFHFVNRLGYLITDEAWEDEYEEYICD